MSDQKIEIGVELEADVENRLVNAIGQSGRVAADIERHLNGAFKGSLRDAKTLAELLSRISQAQKVLSQQLSAMSRGTLVTQITNANTGRVINELRANPYSANARISNAQQQGERRLLQLFERATNPAQTERQMIAAFRRAVTEAGVYGPPGTAAERRRFNERTLEDFRTARQIQQERELARAQLARIEAEKKAQKEADQQRLELERRIQREKAENHRKELAQIREAEREYKRLHDQIVRFERRPERRAESLMAARTRVEAGYGLTAGALGGFAGSLDERQARREDLVPDRNSRLSRLAGRAQLFGDYASIAAVVGAVGYTGFQTVELEKSLSTLQAITRATDQEMAKLGETVFSLGQSTRFSNTELAAAATVLGQAGYSANQVREVLPDIANLALAAGTTIEESTQLVSSIMTVFDMSMSRSTYVADVLTQALNGSKLSLDQLSLGLQYAGNIAADSGVSFEELSAALGAMSNAGIRSGSTLGTGFRAFLQELQSPSEGFLQFLKDADLTLQDVDVRTRDVADVLELLRSKGLDSAKALQMFEIRAASAYSALSSNTDTMRQMIDSFNISGVAATAAERQMNTFTAQLNRLGNAVVEVTAKIGAPFIAALTASMGAIASVLSGLADIGGVIAPALAGLAAFTVAWTVLPPVITAVRSAIAGFTLAAAMSGGVVAGLTGLLVALQRALIAHPVTALVAGLGALAAVMLTVGDFTGRATRRFEEQKTRLNELVGKSDEYKSKIEEIDSFLGSLSTTQSSVNSVTDEAIRKFGEFGLVLDGNVTSIDNVRDAVAKLRDELNGQRDLLAGTRLDQATATRDSARRDMSQGLQRALRSGPTSLMWDAALNPLLSAAIQDPSIDNLTRLQNFLRSGQDNRPEYGRLLNNISALIQNVGQSEQDVTSAQANFRETQISGAASRPQFEAQLNQLMSRYSGPMSSERVRNEVLPELNRILQFYTTAIANETGIDPAIVRSQLDVNPTYQTAAARFPLNDANEQRARRQLELRNAEQAFFTATDSDLASARQRLRDAVIRDLSSGTQNGQYSESDLQQRMEAAEETRRQRNLERGASMATRQRVANARARLDRFRDVGTTTTPYNSFAGTPVSSPFGAAREGGPHSGVDYAHAVGTPLHAPLDGEVIGAGSDPRSGNFVRIRMADGRVVSFAHLSQLGVQTGDRVTRGQQVGLSGNTGNSTGPHTHVKLRAADGSLQDPEQFFASSVEAQVQQSRAEAEEAWADYYEAKRQEQAELTRFMTPEARAQSDAEFEVGLAQERADFLRESSREALTVIAQRYERLRANQESALRLEAELTGQLSEQSLQAYRQASELALQTATAAVENPGTNAWAEEIARLTQEKREQFTQLMIDLAQVSAEAVNRQIENAAAQRSLGFAQQEAEVGRLSNFYGNRNLSDAQRILGERRLREINQARSMDALGVANAQLANGRGLLATLERRLAEGGDEKLLRPQIQQARQEVEELSRAVQELEISISETFGQTAPIDNFRTAAATAFGAFMEQANLNQPIFTTITDGLLGAFNTAQSGFKGLLTDVLTGTKTMGDAFRDFTLSILESLMDLAAEIAAREILKWLINMFAPNFGVGTGVGLDTTGGMTTVGGRGSITGHKMMYQGGLVRAYQGSAAPFRDSVPHLLQPGEFVMSKTATDFIGVDTLRQMNATGNRRMSNMPTVQDAVRRQPDEVNVWVVAPNQKPPMGKKDIVATISEDIMLNGEVKRLIKAVQVGAA